MSLQGMPEFSISAHGYPLIADYHPNQPIACYQNRLITASAFMQEVYALARWLPDRPALINLCDNRYRFLVGFAAALLRGQVTLLPPGRAPGLLQQLAKAYPGMYCLTDMEIVMEGIECLSYPSLNPSAKDTAGINPAIPGQQVAAIAFTSGSTGQPQPHVKSWYTYCRSAALIGRHLGLRLRERVNIIATVPPQHMYGLELTVLLPLQYSGVMDEHRPFFPEDIYAALQAVSSPRILVTTPVHIRACVEIGKRLPPLKFMVSATAPLATALAAEAERLFAARVLEIYGCTEAGSVATRRTIEGDSWRLFDGIHIDCHDVSATLSTDYLPAPIPLSDVVSLRGEREFCLHGRHSDLVNIAGKRTSIGALNHALNAIKGVRDGVFFMPEENADRTSRLLAFAVAPGMTATQILTELRSVLDPIFLPRPLYLVDQLPRTEASKLTRQALQALTAELSRREPPQ